MGKPKEHDPGQTAYQQSQANINSAVATSELNRGNYYGPNGSQTYHIDSINPDGTPNYSYTTTLSGPAQNIYDKGMGSANSIYDANASTYGQNFNNSLNHGLTGQQMADFNSQYKGGISDKDLQDFNNRYSHGADVGNYITSVGNGGGDIQRNLDIGSTSQFMNGAIDNAYRGQMAYLQPQQANQQSDLNAQLAAQGITQGSDAWNRAQSELSRNQTFANQQAYNNAYQNGLAGANTAFGITQGAGNFANSAQQQGYNQAMGNAGLYNHLGDVTTQNNQFSAQLNNQALNDEAKNYFDNANAQNNALNYKANNFINNATLQNNSAQQGYMTPIQAAGQFVNQGQSVLPNQTHQTGGTVANTDVAGINDSNYEAKVGQYNSTIQGISSAAMVAAMVA